MYKVCFVYIDTHIIFRSPSLTKTIFPLHLTTRLNKTMQYHQQMRICVNGNPIVISHRNNIVGIIEPCGTLALTDCCELLYSPILTCCFLSQPTEFRTPETNCLGFSQ